MPKTKHSQPKQPAPTEPIIVAAPDEEDRWPRNVLYKDALGAFCEVRIAIRRAQICRAILTKRLVLPTGFSTWESTRPTLDIPRRVVERNRPALLIGFYGPLKQKAGYAPLEPDTYHDRAIREAEPLLNALAMIQQDEWIKMSGAERWKVAWGLPEIDDYGMTHTLLDFSYMEAEGASELLKLSDVDRRIVLDGSYACRRLDALDEQKPVAPENWIPTTGSVVWNALANGPDEAGRKRAEHERTIANLCNDLGQHDLGEKIEAAISNPATEATFPKSVLFDRFKGHLIDAIKLRWPKDDGRRTAKSVGTTMAVSEMATTERPPGDKRRFGIALSFPGEKREYVRAVDEALMKHLPNESIFYDNRYKHELARPNLDVYLQQIYHDDSELVVVFLCAEYETKEWPGLEWRAIRDIIKKREDAEIMLIKFDDADVSGIFSLDGHIDARTHTSKQVAELIVERLKHNRSV